jgi:rod shape-determining protein MreC
MYWQIRNYVSGFFEILATYRSYLLFLLLIVLAVLLLQTNRNPQIDFLRRRIMGVTTDLAWRFGRLVHSLQDREAIERLERRNMDLARQNILLEDAYLENIKLRHLLRFQERFPLKTQPAAVIMRTRSIDRNTLVLDRGERDGIRTNLNVINDRGLVGKVIETSPEYSVCRLMLDRSFRVAARIQRTRLNGIVYWLGDANEVGFYGVLKNLDVRLGDVVLTSEYSEYFLPNFRVGVVTSVNNEVAGLFKDIRVRTSADFNTLEEVFVVMDTVKALSSGRDFEKNFFGEE